MSSSILFAAIAATLVTTAGLTWLWRQSEQFREQAQSAQVRAEQGKLLSSRVVQQLTELLRQTVGNSAAGRNGQSAELMDGVTKLTALLLQTPELLRDHLVEVLSVEKALAEHFQRESDDTSLRAVLAQARLLAESDDLSLKNDIMAAMCFADLLRADADLHSKYEDCEAAVELLSRAEGVLLQHSTSPLVVPCLLDVHQRRLEILGRFREAGSTLSEQWGQELNDWIRRTGLAISNPDQRRFFEALASLTLQKAATGDKLRVLLQQAHDHPGFAAVVEPMLVDVISMEICDQACREIRCGIAVEIVAGRSFAILREKMALHDLRTALQSQIVDGVAQQAQLLEISARRNNESGTAHAIVAWLLHLGHQLRDSQAESASAHYMLSKGFEHEAKLAWVVEDSVAATASLEQALREATLAAGMDPRSESYKKHFAGIRSKYLSLICDE